MSAVTRRSRNRNTCLRGAVDSASGFYPAGRRFESCRGHQLYVWGRIPTAEEGHLKCLQCGFESHRPYKQRRVEMPRTVRAANEAKYDGAIPRKVLRAELEAFEKRWNLQRRDVAKILDMPERTVFSIFNDHRYPLVLVDTVDQVRKGIRKYDPRTCIYRRLEKEEVSKWLWNIKMKHGVTWEDVAQMVDYPRSKIFQINCKTSQKRYVGVDEYRSMLISYNSWIKNRGDVWAREGVA